MNRRSIHRFEKKTGISVTFEMFAHSIENSIHLFTGKKNIHALSESEQVMLARKDHRHFGVLYERYFDQIFRFVFRRLGGDEASAGDLTQQTFLKAMANLHKYQDRGLPFSAWLYRIAQNEVNLFFRGEKQTRTVDVCENQLKQMLEEGEIVSGMTQEDQEKLVSMINELETEQQDLIELRFFQEMSFREIADIYSITEANAKMRIYRLLEKINQKWNREI